MRASISRLVFTILSAVAEAERERIRDVKPDRGPKPRDLASYTMVKSGIAQAGRREIYTEQWKADSCNFRGCSEVGALTL
jgi:hypothetical protein